MPDQRSPCPISCALELIGDKWTLLIVRDLMLGKTRYSDFAASPERIPTNLLAARLRSLESHGFLERTRYSERPPRYAYTLTPKGQDLLPAMRALARCSVDHVPGAAEPPPPF
ncbi:MAG: helix-turn-helix domain-containing protein [Planctomycetota bacterium]